MKVSRAYSQFMLATYIFVAIPCIFRDLTDAPKGGVLLGKDTANAFGLFRINWFHAVLHIVLAFIGLFALNNDTRARQYAQLNGVLCAALVVLGLASNGTKHFPLNRWDDLVNVLIAALGLVVGFTKLGDRKF